MSGWPWLQESNRFGGFYARSTGHIRNDKDYWILHGSICNTPRASSSFGQEHTAARVASLTGALSS
jgi:hypothetical protein